MNLVAFTCSFFPSELKSDMCVLYIKATYRDETQILLHGNKNFIRLGNASVFVNTSSLNECNAVQYN